MMNSREYHKLVRDKIPRMIAQHGEKVITRNLSDREYQAALRQKLLEETREYLMSEEPEELANLLEVIHAIADSRGIAFEVLESMRLHKRKANGGFQGKVYLETVISNATAENCTMKSTS